MSDIASPILAVMDNEPHAFICFCGIMKRLEGNFRPDGLLMSIKFQHLKLLLQYSDPEFYSYLVSRGADDLFFCYRWLLLELKREFAFEDALRMLEVTWSSLPPDPPETEVDLLGPPLEADKTQPCQEKEKPVEVCLGGDKVQKEKQRRRHMLRPSREEPDVNCNPVVEEKSKPNAGEGVEGIEVSEGGDVPQVTSEKADLPSCPVERQNSFGEFKYYTARKEDSLDVEDADRTQGSVPSEPVAVPTRQSTVDSEDDPGEKTPLIKNCDNGYSSISSPPRDLPIWKSVSSASPTCPASPSSWPGASPESPSKSTSPSTANGSSTLPRTVPKVLAASAQVLSSPGINSPMTPTVKTSVTSPSHAPNRSLLSSPILSFGRGSSNSLLSSGTKSPSSAANTPSSVKADTTSIKPCSLPPPQEFGKGNPFMLFLCLSILLEHRDHIIKNRLDYNELAMHFDRLVRRHNLSRVLQRAKALFADYLQSEVWDSEEGDEVSSDSPTTATAAQPSPSSAVSARPIYSPLDSPQSPTLNSTYNLANTIPSPTAELSLSPTS